MGIDVHLPLAYRYSLSRYQGLGSLNTERTQFIKKLKIFFKHINSTSQLGLSFQTNIETHHLLLGSNQTVFSLDFDKYGFLTVSGWITHLWEMLHKYNIQMRGEYNHTQIAQDQDSSIIDHLITTNTYNKEKLKTINQCRVYLQVINESGITNGQGNHISPSIIAHIRGPDYTSMYKCPFQTPPSSTDWERWYTCFPLYVSITHQTWSIDTPPTFQSSVEIAYHYKRYLL